MNVKPDASALSPAAHFVAAAFAAMLTVGIFSSVTALFLRDGGPFARLAAAERACAAHQYVSEREAWMREAGGLAAAREARAKVTIADDGTRHPFDRCAI